MQPFRVKTSTKAEANRQRACLLCREPMLINHLYLFIDKSMILAFLWWDMAWFVFVFCSSCLCLLCASTTSGYAENVLLCKDVLSPVWHGASSGLFLWHKKVKVILALIDRHISPFSAGSQAAKVWRLQCLGDHYPSMHFIYQRTRADERMSVWAKQKQTKFSGSATSPTHVCLFVVSACAALAFHLPLTSPCSPSPLLIMSSCLFSTSCQFCRMVQEWRTGSIIAKLWGSTALSGRHTKMLRCIWGVFQKD